MSVVPRSMFAYDGTMNLCSSKSNLMTLLKTLDESSEPEDMLIPSKMQTQLVTFCMAIVDGMAELQALEKSADIKTCADLSRSFSSKMMNKFQQYDEVHIVFDTYKTESIKNMTRNKRLHGGNIAEYKINDNTDLRNVSMKKLLSHIRTKDALTDYLAHQILQHAKTTSKNYVVAWRDEAAATHFSVVS